MLTDCFPEHAITYHLIIPLACEISGSHWNKTLFEVVLATLKLLGCTLGAKEIEFHYAWLYAYMYTYLFHQLQMS